MFRENDFKQCNIDMLQTISREWCLDGVACTDNDLLSGDWRLSEWLWACDVRQLQHEIETCVLKAMCNVLCLPSLKACFCLSQHTRIRQGQHTCFVVSMYVGQKLVTR